MSPIAPHRLAANTEETERKFKTSRRANWSSRDGHRADSLRIAFLASLNYDVLRGNAVSP
jgi:hypothetical protein